jgi:hypothetical protein
MDFGELDLDLSRCGKRVNRWLTRKGIQVAGILWFQIALGTLEM